MRLRLATILMVLGLLCAAGCGRVAERAVGSAERAVDRRGMQVLSRDLERDAGGKLARLPRSRQVFKYTTKADTDRFLKQGIPARSHFTSGIKPGRPLKASHATKRFGLAYKPEKRVPVTLPKGTAVKFNKVVGGSPGGFGEIRVEEATPPSAIGKPVRLRQH
jgi:hypothetical protein